VPGIATLIVTALLTAAVWLAPLVPAPADALADGATCEVSSTEATRAPSVMGPGYNPPPPYIPVS
jgi:hypothetical protein